MSTSAQKNLAVNVGIFSSHKDDRIDLLKAMNEAHSGLESTDSPATILSQFDCQFHFYPNPDVQVTSMVGDGLIQDPVTDSKKVQALIASSNQLCPNLDIIIMMTTSRVTYENEALLRVLSRFKIPIILLICKMHDHVGASCIEHLSEYAKYGLFPSACVYIDVTTSQCEKLNRALACGRMASAKIVWYQLAILAEGIRFQQSAQIC